METIEIRDSTRCDNFWTVILGTILVIGVGLAMSDRTMPGLGTFLILCSSLIGSPFIYRLANKRPAFLALGAAVTALESPPVLALTATATPRVLDDIVRQLGLRDPEKYHRNIFVLKRGLSQVENIFGTGDMTLNCMGVDRSPVEIANLISEYQDNFFLRRCER